MAVDTAPFLTRMSKSAFKTEATTGTYEALTAAEAVTPVFNMQITPDVESIDAPEHDSLSKRPARRGARGGSASFEIEVHGSGSASDPFWFTHLMPACGLPVDTNVATVSSTSQATISIGHYLHSETQRALAGAKGSFTYTARRGNAARMAFDFRGAWQQPKKLSLAAITYDDTVAPPCGDTTFAVGAQTLIVPEVVIEVRNEIYLREDVTARDRDYATNGIVTGYRAGTITDRQILVRVSAEALDVDTLNWFASWQAGTTYALSHILGEDNGNKFTFACPKLELIEAPGTGDRKGLQTDELVFRALANSDAGDDELTITFAPGA